MNKLLIVGAGGHGKVVADIALETGKWDNIIFLDDAWPEKIKNGRWYIHGNTSAPEKWLDRCEQAVVAIGDCKLRLSFQTKLRAAGFELPSIVHPSARVSCFAKLGVGCIVCANAVVAVDAEVGDGVIINNSATVDHDCRLGKGVHVAPGANVGGGVVVGDFSWIGIGASVRHYISIGKNVTIGAGAVVVSNIEDNIAAVGSPARPIK